MKLSATMSLLCLAIGLAASLPIRAEEINLKDGTKIVGHMTGMTADKIEVETSYGKVQLNRKEIVSINFPENSPPKVTGGDLDLPKIDETLNGAQYVNRTGKFSLTLPPDWVIREDLRHSPLTLAALGSKDKSRFAIVVREEYPGSLDSYKEMVMLNARTTLSSLERLAESNATIDGKPAMLVYYRGTLKPGTLPAEYLAVIVASGHSYTRITVWCVEPLFRDMQASFESIVNSYRDSGSGPAH